MKGKNILNERNNNIGQNWQKESDLFLSIFIRKWFSYVGIAIQLAIVQTGPY